MNCEVYLAFSDTEYKQTAIRKIANNAGMWVETKKSMMENNIYTESRKHYNWIQISKNEDLAVNFKQRLN